jgi:hypothetical protein
MHCIEQFAWAPCRVGTAEIHELVDDRRIRLQRAAMRSAGKLVIAGFPELSEEVDQFALVPRMGIGGRSLDANGNASNF